MNELINSLSEIFKTLSVNPELDDMIIQLSKITNDLAKTYNSVPEEPYEVTAPKICQQLGLTKEDLKNIDWNSEVIRKAIIYEKLKIEKCNVK